MSLYEKALQFRKATQFAYNGNESALSDNDILSMGSIYEYWSQDGIEYKKDESIVRIGLV